MNDDDDKIQLGARLHRLRIQAGIPQSTAARQAEVNTQTWRRWELGHSAYRPWRAPEIAAALGVPIAQLFVDEPVIAEVRVSPETLKRVRDEGREASQEAAQRLAAQLEPLIYQEATRPPVDVRPGVRAKRRRTRAEVLAGVKAANKARDKAQQRRRELT